MPFQKFGLPSSLLRNIQTLGYVAPTPIQDQAILPIRSGRDLVATAQTGTGKTAAFLLPVLHQLLERPRGATGALVLTPTRELAQQIDGCFRGLAAGTPLRSALVIGGVAEFPQERALRSGVDVVVATPGRLLQHLRNRHALPQLRTLVLDEADQMFDLGFLPDVKRILSFLPPRRQTLLFSATMPPDVERLGRAILRDPLTVAVGTQGKPADTVDQVVYPVPAHRKTALLDHLLEQWERPSVLVFTRTRRGARRLAKALYHAGHKVEELHSDCSPTQRTRAMQGFRDKKVPILVATNIAARGIDVRHITHVVNYDAPAAPEEYVHRIGRTGRGGDAGEALVMMSPDEAPVVARIERQLRKRLPRRRLDDFDYDAPPRDAGKPRREHASAGARPGGRPKHGRGRRQ
ncbi:MAG: DEAD/DEAH box helicase [Gemmataceae bacterium]